MSHTRSESDTPLNDPRQRDRIGEVMRSLRARRGLSVRTLARESGFSPSFISQVEHGLASPSIASMERIAHALGVTLSEFFAAEERMTPVPFFVPAGEGHELASEWSSAVVRNLGPSQADRVLEPVMLVLSAGGRSGAKPAGHRGEEFAFVFAGVAVLRLEDAMHHMSAGDAVSLPSDLPHQWENPSDRDVHIVLVSSRPGGKSASDRP